MRSSPSIVPADRLDGGIYRVLENFGARAGCAWRETDELPPISNDPAKSPVWPNKGVPVAAARESAAIR